ncbi:MAG: protein kinase domain-containing protein [Nannocystales bacterium]
MSDPQATVTSDPEAVTRPEGSPTDGVHSEASRAVRVPFRRGEALGRYVVLEPLGVGGMGIVLAAYDSRLDRRVALKLLHPDESEDGANHARLLREAQALAKLSHRCVVSVYDVGEIRGHVFMAMEIVEGPDLRRWLAAGPRTPREIVAVFRDAGRGLQAAHESGIVHRDFKPDNVLIGPNGRAHVTDFGLALEQRSEIPALPASASASHLPPSARLTQTGIVMGTPAYMPIEQHVGRPADHRSDQYSFAVSLFEALYGRRPFAGANSTELCVAIKRAEVSVPSTQRTAPRRVHRAVLRGLSAKPEDRYPSMRAFVRALTPPVRNRRTWVLGGLGGLAVGAGAVMVADPPQRPCSSFEARVAQAYTPDDKRQLLSAFTATGAPYAQSSFDAATRSLDAFSEDWVEAASDACLAAERGEQSGRMLDLRMACLDRGLRRLQATTEVLALADARTVERAADLAEQLPRVGPCSDSEVISRGVFIPETDAQHTDARELLPVLEKASVLMWQENRDSVRAVLEPFKARLTSSTHPRVRAQYKIIEGRTLRGPERLALLHEALAVALEHNLDDLAANASVSAAYAYKDELAETRAVSMFEQALALGRASGQPLPVLGALAGLAKVAEVQLRYDDAIEHAREAVRVSKDIPTFGTQASTLLLLSELLHKRDGATAGLEELEVAHALLVREVGANHPAQEEYLQEVLTRANERGDSKKALETSKILITLLRRNRGPGSTREAVTLANVASAQMALGLYEDALESVSNSDEYFRKDLGDDYAHRAGLLNNRGTILIAIGRLDDARTAMNLSRSLFEAHLGPGTEATGVTQLNLSEIERLAENLEAARTHALEARAIFSKRLGPEHVRIARADVALAQVELADNEPDTAWASIARALAIGTPKPAEQRLWDLLQAEAILRSTTRTAAERRQALATVDAVRNAPALRSEYTRNTRSALTRIDAL